MSAKRNKKTRHSVIKYIICFGFFAYVGYTFIVQQIAINNKKAELEAINEQIVVAESEKEALIEEKKTVNTPEYIEEVARTDLNMAAPGEIVFIDATAKD
ncbi:MAG: septum formation initiator family protein [Clostridia bacterium]|nr:septum formation initiator family protein [Clostridia bacterium]